MQAEGLAALRLSHPSPKTKYFAFVRSFTNVLLPRWYLTVRKGGGDHHGRHRTGDGVHRIGRVPGGVALLAFVASGVLFGYMAEEEKSGKRLYWAEWPLPEEGETAVEEEYRMAA